MFRSPLFWFFLIAFGLPWAGWSTLHILDIYSAGTPLSIVLFYTGDFCSIAGLVAIAVYRGKAGAGELLRRCIRVRVPAIWWALTLLIPITYAFVGFVVTGAMSGGLGTFAPVAGLSVYLAPAVLMNFTTGPWGEELGWRGFLTPWLLERQNALTTSLIVGFLWGIWHWPLYVNSSFSTLGGAAIFTASTMITSIIMTAILLHTRGSVLLAVLYHWLINASPGVVRGMFPDIDWEATNAVVVSELLFKGLIALGFVLVLGKHLCRDDRLRQQVVYPRSGNR